MKFLILVFSVFASLNLFAQSNTQDLKTVDFVDPVKYVGRWYQIARNPLPFEPSNCVCAQQTLGLTNEGTVSVYNSCNVESPTGELKEVRGFATNDDPVTNARFTVDFGFPQKGQYWIIGLAENYQWAVVSDPSRRSLYILSKTPELSAENFEAALAGASRQVDTSKLKSTSQLNCQYP